MTRHIAGILTLLFFVVTLLSVNIGNGTAQAQTGERCFSETGYCISGNIRVYWERYGGLPVFGYPITTQRTETIEGTWTGPTQWFERDRLEDHGDQGVMAGRLGADILERTGTPWQNLPGVDSAASSCYYFAVTRHSLCEPFLSYWQNNGGLERFGYPVTEAYVGTIEDWTGSIQYFERRRMEHHTEYSGTAYEVLLGLLGNEIRELEAGSSTATPTTTTTPGQTSTPTTTSSTTTTPQATATATLAADTSNFTTVVLERINAYRSENGCSPLIKDDRLQQAAQDHSVDMAKNDFFSHTGSNGSTPWSRIKIYGYQHLLIGENIFAGANTPSDAVNGWKASEETRTNMLNCDMQHVGIGFFYLKDDTGSFNQHTYWTAVFARPLAPTETPGPTSTPTATPKQPTTTPTTTPVATSTPTVIRVATVTPTTKPDLNDFVRRVVERTNSYRSQNGCQPLTLESRLTQAAQKHAEDMANSDYFSHTGLNGSTPWDRITATGYTYSTAAENIFAGAGTPEEAVDGWYDSEGHRKNMLNCDLEQIGVGYYYLENDTGNVNYHTYWVQVFGTP